MLNPSEHSASIVVCNTCRHDADNRENEDGKRGGALMADALRAAKAEGDYDDIAIEEMACLFACSRFCTIHLRETGKISYVLGDFKPTAEDAHAILEFFQHYKDSEHGYVQFKKWPEGVKGHFITRQPPAGQLVGNSA